MTCRPGVPSSSHGNRNSVFSGFLTAPLLSQTRCRGGANRGYHEAIGSLMGLASMQQPFIEAIGLDVGAGEPDPIQTLLQEALDNVVFIPWSCGVMTHFEHELYEKPLSINEYNRRWWELKARYQGIAPPSERGEEFARHLVEGVLARREEIDAMIAERDK